jgi:hypothetical protein
MAAVPDDGQRMARARQLGEPALELLGARALVSQPHLERPRHRGDLLRAVAGGWKRKVLRCWRTAASSISKRIESAARQLRGHRRATTVRARIRRSDPRKKGPTSGRQ